MKKKSLSFKIALTFIMYVMFVFLLFGCAPANNTANNNTNNNTTNDTSSNKDGLQLTLKANIDSATVSGGGYYQKNEDVSISVNTPDGYKFLGWYYDQDLISSSAKYNLKMWDKDVTLDAKFVANITYGDSDGSSSSSSSSWYSLTVKSNSRKHGDISVSASNLNSGYAHKYEKNVTIGYNIKVTALTKTSIRFLGWYDGIDTLVMPNASFEFMMPSTDFILIAKWAEGDEIIKNNVKYEEQDDGTYAVTGVSDKDAEKLTIESSINKKAVSLIEKAAFVNCKNLKSISIPESIQKISDGAFSGCKKLTNISIPNDEIRIGDNTFNGCPIETASIPTRLISYIPKQKLKTLIITGGTSIGSNTFSDCDRLTSVTMGASVTLIDEDAFLKCGNLTDIIVDENNETYKSVDGILYSKDEKTLIRCAIGKTSCEISAGATYINKGAFSECNKLTSIIWNVVDCKTDLKRFSIFSDCSQLKTVEFGKNVQIIPAYAFSSCNSLTSVTIGNSVTSIGDCAFDDCSGLTSITIGNSVTSIGEYAFRNCSGLISVTIGNSVTSIGDCAFDDCSGLEKISVATGNTKYHSAGNCLIKTETKTLISGCKNSVIPTDGSVTSIGKYAFRGCRGLKTVTIPNSVTSIGDSAFSGCSSLESMTIPFVGAEADVNLKYTYQYPFGYIWGTRRYEDCVATTQYYYIYRYSERETTTYYLPFSLKNVTVAGGKLLNGAFYNCSGLTSITIPDSVTSIGSSAFYNCNGLTSITIPDSVTSIGSSAFYDCSGLTSITIPDSVTSIGFDAFSGCRGLKGVYITDLEKWCKISFDSIYSYLPSSNPLYYAHNLYLNKKLVTDLVIPNSVTSIGEYAFYECSSLTSVTIPDSVTFICNRAFEGCSGLTSITIPNSVTSIGEYAFCGCSGLTSITIPDKVTSIGEEAFRDCSGLTSVTIGNSVTSIGGSAFRGCSGLEKISVVAGNTKYLSAGNCLIETKTKTLILGCKNSIIPTDGSVTSIGWYAFSGCSGLTSVTIPNSVTSIGWYAFSGCSGLTNITIGNSVTSIGEYAFRNCSGLISVTIGNSVTSIGYCAFDDCSGLNAIYYKGTAAEWKKIYINYYNSNLTSATRYYYSETKPTESGNFWHYNKNGEIEEW